MTYQEWKNADITGATITCNGRTYIIETVYSYEVYQDWQTGKFDFYIEFRDVNGILRNWKSPQDGGTIELEEIPFPEWAYKK